ncbi:MAG: transglycosylase SLT domain-containing protein, partial [Ignavibacteriota bacterium]
MTQQELEQQLKKYRKINLRAFKKKHRSDINELPKVMRHNFLRQIKLALAGAVIFFLGAGTCAAAPDSTTRITERVSDLVEAIRGNDSAEAADLFLIPFKADILAVANIYHLPPGLLAAFIQEESAFDQFAMRTEPGYLKKKRVIAEARAWSRAHQGLPTAASETFARSTSWGPMQVMGQVAREQGFDEKYLTSLITPFNSIDQGAKLLQKNLKRYRGDTLSAV